MRSVAILLLVLPLVGVVPAAQRPVPSHTPAAPAVAAAITEVARVNGVAVTSDRLAAALSSLIPQESFHRHISEEKLASIRRQALASIIDEELAYQDGVRRGITVSQSDVRKAWAQTVARYGGASAFQNALRQSGITKVSVEQEINRRLVVEKNYTVSVMNACGVTRSEAQRFFTEHPERFVEPEQLHVHAITVGVDPSSPAARWREAKARVDEARAALDRGTPFAEVARTYSTDPSRDAGGDMGFIHRGSLAPPFDAVVESLSAGTPSPVIESLYGYHVVLVSEARPPLQKTFDQVAATLVGDLASARCAERKDAWLAGLRAAARIQTSGLDQ